MKILGKYFQLFITLLFALAVLAPGGVALAKPDGYESFLLGNPADVATQTSPGFLLAGGNTDVDSAMQWLIDQSGGGDFVVIRASGTDAYNPYIYSELGRAVDSVETIIMKQDRAAYDPYVIGQIRNAEALFIAGGNQWDYVRMWKGTPVEDAIQELVARGVPVGGTSAGLAILGEFSFSAEKNTIYSDEALKNPYNPRLTLENDFLHLPYLQGTITDSHFVERDRMGRLVTFLARILQDGWANQARGIGIDGKTALAVDGNGIATLHGAGAVYFLRTTTAPEVCQKNTPLTFRDVEVFRLSGAGSTFDLATWTGTSGLAYSLSAVEGALISTQKGGEIY
jgi:cyanophycinase